MFNSMKAASDIRVRTAKVPSLSAVISTPALHNTTQQQRPDSIHLRHVRGRGRRLWLHRVICQRLYQCRGETRNLVTGINKTCSLYPSLVYTYATHRPQGVVVLASCS
jgi:hypothetical protein